MKSLRRLLLLPALALAVTAATCTEEKIVDLVLGLPVEVEVEFQSTGGINVHDDTDWVDLRDELDLASELDDADIEPSEVTKISVVQVFYRITQPQAGRSITNGELEIARGTGLDAATFVASAGPVDLATGFTADASAVTPWIDITERLQPGLSILNGLLADLLNEVKTGTPALNPVIRYHVSGNSEPAAEVTDIKWEIKIVVQVVGQREFEVPFG